MSKIHLCRAGNCCSCHILSYPEIHGDISFLKIFSDLVITPGIFTSKGAEDCDNARIKLSAKKSSEKMKKRRKTLRHLRKQYIDSAEDKEGATYEAGGF
jgi:hypothetical protein